MADRILTKKERDDLLEKKFLLFVQQSLENSSSLEIRTLKYDTTEYPIKEHVSDNLYSQKLGYPKMQRLLNQYGYKHSHVRKKCDHWCTDCEYGDKIDTLELSFLSAERRRIYHETRYCSESDCCFNEECRNGW